MAFCPQDWGAVVIGGDLLIYRKLKIKELTGAEAYDLTCLSISSGKNSKGKCAKCMWCRIQLGGSLMISIASLWMPIVLSAVIVFIASSIMHMALKYHRSDYKKLPNEDEVAAALRKDNLSPGVYYFPHMSGMSELKSPAMIEKFTKGPVGMVRIRPSGPPGMGKSLVQWFLFSIVIGVFVAYLGGRFLPAGTHYLTVFRFAGTVAFMGYGVGQIMDSVWEGRPWSMTIKGLIDGLIYASLLAGTFGWLWPR